MAQHALSTCAPFSRRRKFFGCDSGYMRPESSVSSGTSPLASSHMTSQQKKDQCMTGRHNLLVSMLFCLCVNQPAMAAAETDATCSAQREHISQQIKDARLNGDSGQRVLLEAQLQNLTERCSGVVPLQPNHAEIERAMRLATTREAQLREALGTGDQQVIEVSKRRLDQARKQLEAAKH
ncbi:DUF1090 family protein [Pseudomonas xanthomarina]|nr:DUF1090 family protein [Stutzerimonas xanthomarina]